MDDSLSRPVPPGLAKRGLVQCSDNLPDGARLVIDAREFVRLFRTEMEARFVQAARTAASQGERS